MRFVPFSDRSFRTFWTFQKPRGYEYYCYFYNYIILQPRALSGLFYFTFGRVARRPVHLLWPPLGMHIVSSSSSCATWILHQCYCILTLFWLCKLAYNIYVIRTYRYTSPPINVYFYYYLYLHNILYYRFWSVFIRVLPIRQLTFENWDFIKY